MYYGAKRHPAGARGDARRRRTGARFSVAAAASALWLALAAAPATAEAPWFSGRLRVMTGFDYRSGDFGSDAGNTHLLSVPVTVGYRFDRLRFSPGDRFRVRVTVPYLRVDGPFRGEASTTGGTGFDDGVGDVDLTASYLYSPPSKRWPFVELSGRVKFPTADEAKNLGTGEFDFALETRLFKQFKLGHYRLTPYAFTGYKFVGDPEGETRNNTWRAGTGVSLRLGPRFSVGARYSWRESSIPGRGGRHEIGPFLGIRITDRFGLHPYAIAGLSARSPDYAVGMQFRFDTTIH